MQNLSRGRGGHCRQYSCGAPLSGCKQVRARELASDVATEWSSRIPSHAQPADQLNGPFRGSVLGSPVARERGSSWIESACQSLDRLAHGTETQNRLPGHQGNHDANGLPPVPGVSDRGPVVRHHLGE